MTEKRGYAGEAGGECSDMPIRLTKQSENEDNPLIQYQQSCHSHLGERLRTPRRFSFFERQLLIVFCWTQYDSPHVTELSPTRAQFHGKIRETSQSNSIEARHDYRCQRRRDGRRVSAAMLRPITPDQDGPTKTASAPPNAGAVSLSEFRTERN
jgi:hypothetical protein